MNAYIMAAVIVQLVWLVVQLLSKDSQTKWLAFRFNATIGGILVLGAMIHVLSTP